VNSTDHRTKIFIGNVGIIFGIVFLGSLSADAVFGGGVALARNLFVSAVAAGLAALAQAKAYLQAEEGNPPGNPPYNAPSGPVVVEAVKGCVDPEKPGDCRKVLSGPRLRLFVLIPW